MKNGYHEIYGHLPKEVINHLSDIDKKLAFLSWMNLEPTEGGTLITKLTVRQLGSDFIDYIAVQVVQAIIDDGMVPTREGIIGGVKEMLEVFSTDTNVLCEYVNDYLDKKRQEEKPGIMDLFKTTLDNMKNSDREYRNPTAVSSAPLRDPKTGRFVKKG